MIGDSDGTSRVQTAAVRTGPIVLALLASTVVLDVEQRYKNGISDKPFLGFLSYDSAHFSMSSPASCDSVSVALGCQSG